MAAVSKSFATTAWAGFEVVGFHLRYLL
jgi:hypothetical protein